MTTHGNIQTSINQKFEEREAQKKALKWKLPYINLTNFPVNPEVLKILPEKKSLKSGLIPFLRTGFTLKVAVVNFENPNISPLVDFWESKDLKVEINICSQTGFDMIFEHYHSKLINKKVVEMVEVFKETEQQTFESESESFKKLGEKLEKLRSGEALNEVEILAIQLKCSDIHLQPYAEKGLLRFRINGILHNICEIPRKKAEKIVSRIKYNAGMKSNVYNIPQDGHLSFKANDRDIDLRVSTLPTEYFESVVMRVLDSRKGILKLEKLGFHPEIIKILHKDLQHKDGMILVTGPTGSGKTTTLYSMLKELNTESRKIVTLEDPIEYHIENITQSQVQENSDYSFSTGLKSLLRHDPDVVLIGEIRELSTAKLASEASLTGHVVLSSLHTNSSLGAITRLRNLGLESFNIATAVNVVLAQRLVRKVCHNCVDIGEEKKLSSTENKRVTPIVHMLIQKFPEILEYNSALKNIDNLPLKRKIPKGCSICSHTGFVGQTVAAEVVDFSPKLRESITHSKTEYELFKQVKEEQPYFLTLFEDGIRKVLMGETTLDEVYRVIG